MNAIALNNVGPLIKSLLDIHALRRNQLQKEPYEAVRPEVYARAERLLDVVFAQVPTDLMNKAVAYAKETRKPDFEPMGADDIKALPNEDALAYVLAVFLMLSNVNSRPLEGPGALDMEASGLQAMLFTLIGRIFQDTGLSVDDFALLTGAPLDGISSLLIMVGAIATKAGT